VKLDEHVQRMIREGDRGSHSSPSVHRGDAKAMDRYLSKVHGTKPSGSSNPVAVAHHHGYLKWGARVGGTRGHSVYYRSKVGPDPSSPSGVVSQHMTTDDGHTHSLSWGKGKFYHGSEKA